MIIISLVMTVAGGIEWLPFPCSPPPVSAVLLRGRSGVSDFESFRFDLLSSSSTPNFPFVPGPDFSIELALWLDAWVPMT